MARFGCAAGSLAEGLGEVSAKDSGAAASIWAGDSGTHSGPTLLGTSVQARFCLTGRGVLGTKPEGMKESRSKRGFWRGIFANLFLFILWISFNFYGLCGAGKTADIGAGGGVCSVSKNTPLRAPRIAGAHNQLFNICWGYHIHNRAKNRGQEENSKKIMRTIHGRREGVRRLEIQV